MSVKQKNWAAIGVMFFGLFVLSFVGSLIAQQQFSGGQSVTIAAGSAAIGTVTVTSAPTTAVTGTFWQATQPVSLATAPALVASTALIGETYPYTGCGTTKVESGSPAGFAALSASTVTLESSTTCVLTFIVTNTGSTSLTYYVTDNAATPIPVIGSSTNPVTILPGERDEYTFQNGSKFNAGIKMTASGTTGSYYLLGIQ